MKTQITVVSLLFFCFAAWGEEVVEEISWKALLEQDRLISGDVETSAGEEVAEWLTVANGVSEPTTIPVLRLQEPGITSDKYALTGRIRYEDVEGDGYLEMWSHLPGEGKFFSKTLGDRGEMGKIVGSSGWRSVKIPFFISNSEKRPTEIELNVVLPGKGVVQLGPLRLIQFAGTEDPMAAAGEWWSEMQGGLMGGILGGLAGLFGCLAGIGGSLASRGRGRAFAFATLILMASAGGIQTILGMIAAGLSQPYHVYYPLLLVGVLELFLGILFIPVFRSRYAQFELRKMDAMDASSR